MKKSTEIDSRIPIINSILLVVVMLVVVVRLFAPTGPG